MALKPDREELVHDIRWVMKEVAERGGIASVSTVGSGGYPGDATNVATYAAVASGKYALGMLMNDFGPFVDQSQYHRNFAKEAAQSGDNAVLMVAGWATTNMIIGTPAGGEAAYLGASGNITPTVSAVAPKVGQFLTKKDEDGYAAVRINIQV